MGKLICTSESCGHENTVAFGIKVTDCEKCGTVATSRFNQAKSELRPVSEKREREAKAAGKPMPRALKQRQPRRDWTDARAKIDEDPTCRFCGREDFPERLEAAHIDGRDRDGFDPVTREPRPEPWHVHPDRIVAAHPDCHREYDAHRGRGLLGKLTLAEEIQAVRDLYPPVPAGTASGSGISLSLRRLDPAGEGRLAA